MPPGPNPLAIAKPLAEGPAGLFGRVPARGPFPFLGHRPPAPLLRWLLYLEPGALNPAEARLLPEPAGAERVVLIEAGEEAAESAGGGVEGIEMARDRPLEPAWAASNPSASSMLLLGSSWPAEGMGGGGGGAAVTSTAAAGGGGGALRLSFTSGLCTGAINAHRHENTADIAFPGICMVGG